MGNYAISLSRSKPFIGWLIHSTNENLNMAKLIFFFKKYLYRLTKNRYNVDYFYLIF